MEDVDLRGELARRVGRDKSVVEPENVCANQPLRREGMLPLPPPATLRCVGEDAPELCAECESERGLPCARGMFTAGVGGGGEEIDNGGVGSSGSGCAWC